MDAKIISFINMKGGVGKTTLCKEVACYLTERFEISEEEKKRNLRVLLIDIDPQANLTQSLLERFERNIPKLNTNIGEKRSIEKIFSKDITGMKDEDIILKLTDNLHLIPGELETVFLERSQSSNTASKLLDFIMDFKIREKYDYVILDCPPTYSVYTEMALYCSDFYFVPVVPDAYSTLGVDLLERVVEDIIYHKRHSIFKERKPYNLGVIFTRVDLADKPKQQNFIEALKDSDLVERKEIYTFGSHFIESNKVSTAEFDKYIIDRDDTRLDTMMIEICEELLQREGECYAKTLVTENK